LNFLASIENQETASAPKSTGITDCAAKMIVRSCDVVAFVAADKSGVESACEGQPLEGLGSRSDLLSFFVGDDRSD